jgi:2-keto-4-pentenoate hydratase/2-oxohepta-3-ene-1,7-dioic acid hydratase in catechol pathway
MLFTRYLDAGVPRIGRYADDHVEPWSSETLVQALNGDGRSAGAKLPLDRVHLLPTLDPGAKILCVALNYVDHAKEAKQPLPETPILFFKSHEAMIAAGAPIAPPRIVKQLDYEGEIAIVIGRPTFEVSAADAWSHIAGIVPFNDGSSRDLLSVKAGERVHLDWFSAKCIDQSTPIGPAVAQTADLLADLQANRTRVVTRVNGEERQNASIADMIFGISEIVAFASSRVRLSPGDVIATGTPPGVGFATGRYLGSGDVVEISVSGLPVLRNRVA